MISLRVYGKPTQQGSKDQGVDRQGRPFMYEKAKGLPAWRKAIITEARLVMEGRAPLDGALCLKVTFFMFRGKTVKRDLPSVPPDLDKLIRGVGDALKIGGVYVDDARLTVILAMKVYADAPEDQGCLIEVMPVYEWSGLAG